MPLPLTLHPRTKESRNPGNKNKKKNYSSAPNKNIVHFNYFLRLPLQACSNKHSKCSKSKFRKGANITNNNNNNSNNQILDRSNNHPTLWNSIPLNGIILRSAKMKRNNAKKLLIVKIMQKSLDL